MTNGVTYYYLISVVNGVGNSNSTEVNETPRTKPSAPLNVQASYGDREVTLTWDPAANGGSAVTGYRIYRSLISGFSLGSKLVKPCVQILDQIPNRTTYPYVARPRGTVFPVAIHSALAQKRAGHADVLGGLNLCECSLNYFCIGLIVTCHVDLPGNVIVYNNTWRSRNGKSAGWESLRGWNFQYQPYGTLRKLKSTISFAFL